jgi:hypothetical protein
LPLLRKGRERKLNMRVGFVNLLQADHRCHVW